MDIPEQNNVSSIEAIASSIKTDQQVSRWFTYLITRPAVKSKLMPGENIKELYNRLKITASKQRATLVLLFIALLFIFLTKNYFVIVAVIILSYPWIKLHTMNKQLVAEISTHLISIDFDLPTLHKKTLYQVCEQFSRAYDTPSLVDTIYYLDNIIRYGLLAVGVIILIIRPIGSTLLCGIIVFMSYHIINEILKLNIVYKNLR